MRQGARWPGRSGPGGCVCVRVYGHLRVCLPTSVHLRACVQGMRKNKGASCLPPTCPAFHRQLHHQRSPSAIRTTGGRDGVGGDLWQTGEPWKMLGFPEVKTGKGDPVDSQQEHGPEAGTGHGAEAGTGHRLSRAQGTGLGACGAGSGVALSAMGPAAETAVGIHILGSRTVGNQPPSLGFRYGGPS